MNRQADDFEGYCVYCDTSFTAYEEMRSHPCVSAEERQERDRKLEAMLRAQGLLDVARLQ